LQHAPGNESIHFNLALALYQKGRAADAITQFAEALEIDPNDVEAQNNLAWLLATAPDAAARNGPRAVQLATQSVQLTGGRNPVVLGTLAAAFAEAGRFDDAAAAARQGIMVAQAEGRQDVAAKLAREMGRYEAKLPLRQ
jgi:Flp pilus assembly protein TadD